MPHEICQVGHRLGVIGLTVVGYGEDQLQLPQCRLRFHLNQHGKAAWTEQGCDNEILLTVHIRYCTEQWNNHGFQFVQGLATQDDESHYIGGVVRLIEADKLIANTGSWPVGQCFQ